MRKDEALQGYARQFRISTRTLERDLRNLRNQNLVRFDGEKRAVHWRLA